MIFDFFTKIQILIILGAVTSLLLPSQVYAQNQSEISAATKQSIDSLATQNYFALADSLLREGRFDSAIYYYEKSAIHFNDFGSLKLYFKAKIKVASTLRRQRKLDMAISSSQEIRKEIILKMGENSVIESFALEVMANCHNIKSEFDLALKYQLRIVEIRTSNKEVARHNIADAYSNLAITYFRKGYIDLALESFKKVVDIRKAEYGSDHLLVADAYHNLGFFYSTVGEWELSLEYYLIALSVYKRLYNEDHFDLGNVYNGIGQVLEFKEQYEEAISYFEKAYAIGKKTFGENHYLVSDAYINIANVNFKMHNYKAALDFNIKTLRLNKIQYGENNIATANSYLNIGKCYEKLGDVELSRINLFKSKAIFENIFDEKNPELVNIHNAIGSFYLSQNLLDSALHYFQEGIIVNTVHSSGRDLGLTPDLDNVLDKNLFLVSLYNKAHVLVKKHEEDNNIKNLKLALEIFKTCDQLNDKIRNSRLLSSDRLSLGNVVSEIFNEAIETSEKLFRLTEDAQYANTCFYFSEKNKGNLLHESLSRSSAIKYSSVPDSLISIEKILMSDLLFWQSRLINLKNNKNTQAIDSLETKIFTLKREHESVVKKFELDYPDYYKLKYERAHLSIDDVQKKLGKNSALLEYAINKNTIYIIAITSSDFQICKVDIDSTFQVAFEDFQNFLRSPKLVTQTIKDVNRYTSAAHYLYNNLLASIGDLIQNENLIIIPDQELALIPFETLVTKRTKSETIDYKKIPYVIRTHNVSYANSAKTLYSDLHNTSFSKTSKNVMAFAPTFNQLDRNLDDTDELRESLGPLAWAEEEIKGLQSYFEGDNYYGEYATEKVFKENAQQYRVIHIASHSVLNHQKPMQTKIAFSLDKSDTLNDGYLHMFELYNMRLNSELAVLSACNTANGKVQKGEGIMSLGHAFSYAGIPSVVMSQWQVDDKSTHILMGSFYKYLSEGAGKSEALRRAKLDLMNNDNYSYSSPYYWGAFVAFGNDAPLSFESNYFEWYFYIISLALVSCLLLYMKRRKESGNKTGDPDVRKNEIEN